MQKEKAESKDTAEKKNGEKSKTNSKGTGKQWLTTGKVGLP